MIIPLGFAHVVHLFSGGGLPRGAATTHGVSFVGQAVLADKAEGIADAFEDTIRLYLASEVTYLGCRVKAGPNDVGPEYTAARARPGALANAMTPPNTAWLLKKKSALGGRQNRGRMYVPGIVEDATIHNGKITASSLTQMQTAADNYMAALASNDSPMVILHTASSDPTTVVSLDVDPTVATQRRRLR
jgi:hypothetical protein